MKKNEYQAPKMVAVKLNKKPTLLVGSCTTNSEITPGCMTECATDED